MKSPISLMEKHQQESPIKAKGREKTEKTDFLFQSGINHTALNDEMKWLQQLIDIRCRELFSEEITEAGTDHKIPEPPKADDGSPYSITVQTHQLTAIDRVILALGIASSHYPSILKTFVQIEESSNAFAIEAGGEYNKVSRSFKPTFQTALFLLAGKDLSLWSYYSEQLITGSVLLQNDIVYNRSSTEFIHGKIELDTAYLNYFLSGKKPQLDHGSYFPGKLYQSDLTMDDIILEHTVREQIKPIGHYIKALENGFFQGKGKEHSFKPGFIALFYGAPGTGKTMLAGILANTYGIDMYHVDLSQVVSKYIGETEKNLEVLFNRLQGKNCMLFFDEADALFGKRSDVKDAHDRYANQEVSYLLQRIEKFDGLTILASNFENNMDDAFKRRIDVSINVIRPSETTRENLWKHYLPKNVTFESDDLLKHITKEYSYTGANIRNIMKNAAIALHDLNETIITHSLLSPYLMIENEKAFGKNQSRLSPFVRNSG
ncbi:AAA+ superfamily predicted ATPase [Chryseobacterium sp. SORGH_AS 447]|uniref:ATP-binding protein n=1 Tax=Chryseobacterium sp. SORGH_AS_0447 TaxID=3041769 RepID=UPI00277FFBD1|nr:ATP-binding protein [Chryseobacterium sp. SORGH_AS_0447]MDQ1161413.1 AAA+ superfamily predicted ATPase [Chryseobacterium sp. SORGH_AS_0447]